MNMKIIAVLLAVVVVGGGAATYYVLSQDKAQTSYDAGSFEIVGRVNSEGSGLFIKTSELSGTDPLQRNGTNFFDAEYKITAANKAAWSGLILGDPGATSIQHTQLAAIASNAGLEFKQFIAGTTPNANTLYYVTNLSDMGKIQGDTDIQGGIIWEPQFQRVITEVAGYQTLALTNDIFSEHTCCVVAAKHSWLTSHSDAASQFLAGYVKGVNFVKAALADPTSENYTWLVNYAKANMAAGTLTVAEVEAAFAGITYLSADGADGNLSALTADVKDLATNLKNLGLITSNKFNNADAFSKAFVNDTYMKKAVANDYTKTTATVRVAAINGDIHQIAIQVAMEKNYFDEGLTVELNTTPAAGGAVATLLVSGDADIGFLGAPPATLTTINGNLIQV
jgi:ABC-type nitrate/sulfonate/bicarbonate transport system substrate-binding protein